MRSLVRSYFDKTESTFFGTKFDIFTTQNKWRNEAMAVLLTDVKTMI